MEKEKTLQQKIVDCGDCGYRGQFDKELLDEIKGLVRKGVVRLFEYINEAGHQTHVAYWRDWVPSGISGDRSEWKPK